MNIGKLLTFFACLALLSTAPVYAKDGKKIYISADMEGLAGAVTGGQVSEDGFEYERFRKIYTAEVNAAIDAAISKGATEIVVSDSHGNGQSLLVDELNDTVQLIRSWPRPLGMMQGIDETFDGAFFIGYHASAVHMNGVMSHTMSGGDIADMKLNGVSMSEASFNAAIAGHYDVPVLMVSGDEAIAEEATSIIGDIETAIVKWANGFLSAKTLMPKVANKLINAKAQKAMAKIGKIKPYKLTGPIKFDIRFQGVLPAEVLSYLSTVERLDARTIRYVGTDMVDVSRFFQFVEAFSLGLKP